MAFQNGGLYFVVFGLGFVWKIGLKDLPIATYFYASTLLFVSTDTG